MSIVTKESNPELYNTLFPEDEIKEILDKLRSDDYYEKEYQKSVYYERDLNKIEDYITNLQEENRMLKQSDRNTYETSQEIMGEMSEEIQRLKEERKELYRYTPENGFRRVDEDE